MEQEKTIIKEELTKEEKATKRRDDRVARERDRERKRAKRQNPAYRLMEQERDRERKKALRSDMTFRSLEKMRDRMRKERKRFNEFDNTEGSGDELITIGEALIEPEVILSTYEYPLLCPEQPSPSMSLPVPVPINFSPQNLNPDQNRI